MNESSGTKCSPSIVFVLGNLTCINPTPDNVSLITTHCDRRSEKIDNCLLGIDGAPTYSNCTEQPQCLIKSTYATACVVQRNGGVKQLLTGV